MTTPSTNVTCVDTGTIIHACDAFEFIHGKTGQRVAPLCEEAYKARQAGKPMNTVHHPNHYNGYSVECIEWIELFPHNLGAAIKYVWRAGEKGDVVRDLNKALWYLEREYERMKKELSLFHGHSIKCPSGLLDRMHAVVNEEMEEWRADPIGNMVRVDAGTLRVTRDLVERVIDMVKSAIDAHSKPS